VALAELHGGTGNERVRVEWLQRRLADAPGSRRVDDAGNLVWTFGPRPYRLAVLAHVDDVFGEATPRGITERDSWLCGARHACRGLAPEAVLALEGHGSDRIFTEAVGSLRVRLTVTGPGGHSWWDRGRPSAVHELVRLLHDLTGPPAPLSVNVGLIDGGTGVNAIAARHPGGRPRLLRGRGHARPDRADPRGHHRRRRRAAARRPG
jgi:hypothetical protein